MSPRRSLFGDTDGEWGRRNRGGVDGDLDITPMIDVTFLLLIFFMVSSTMQGSPDLDVPVAEHGVGVQTDGAVVITVRAPGTLDPTQPTIILGDGAGPRGTVDDVLGYVEEHQQQGKWQVIIKADREVPHGFVQQVGQALAGIDGIKFYLGVQDRRASSERPD